MIRFVVTPTFSRASKRLHPGEKAALDAAIRALAAEPEAGEAKRGDLAGVRVLKFRLRNQLCLLAYARRDEETIKLLALGAHENFYRDLKRS